MEERNLNRQDEARGLINRTIIMVKGKAKVGEAGIERTQTAEVSETAFTEQDITEVPECPCGAPIPTIEELGAVDCITNDYLCLACASTKCARCLKSVGVESRVNLIDNVYCKKCARKLGVFILVSLIVVVAVVCFVLFG
jgi:hypothetical protein